MATLVEDIVQALKNLGGVATLQQIYDEVKRIRKVPLPVSWQANIREGIESHSSDSKRFRGKDLFRKVGKGTWALREYVEGTPYLADPSVQSHISTNISFSEGREDSMATWVEDIVQALKNLGGQAHRKQIFEEIKRIRKEPLPDSLEQTIQRTIQDHSSDSIGFRGNDLFKKLGNGVWALREYIAENPHQPENSVYNHTYAENLDKWEGDTTTWVQDIIQALKNLGGQATLAEIYEEVRAIRTRPLPENFKAIIRERIEAHSSDSAYFKGKDYFKKIGKGVWALRDFEGQFPVPGERKKASRTLAEPQRSGSFSQQRVSFENYQPPESAEEISIILQTIREYREYYDPDTTEWLKYIKEFFQIFGFHTQEIHPRLYLLNLPGKMNSPEAVLLLVHPGENFQDIVPGLSWESYCLFAAKYYQTPWGIITNGIQLRVICYEDNKTGPFFWQDMDRVIQNEQIEAFFSIYKVVSYIKASKIFSPSTTSVQENPERRHELRMKFWEQLLDKAKEKTQLHIHTKPTINNYIGAGAGMSGLAYNYIVLMDSARVELYISRPDGEWNNQTFQYFSQNKEAIESLFGEPLDWQPLPDKNACRICYWITDYGLSNEDSWEELQDRLIDAMVRLQRAFQPYIRRMKFSGKRWLIVED